MPALLVVNSTKHWPLNIPGVQVIQARRYLTDPALIRLSGIRVFNLCKSYRYQSLGYYVSLLAAARGHKPVPDVSSIRDLQTPTIIRLVSEDLDHLIQTSLAPIQSKAFTLSVYFGRNLARRYDRLSLQLFNLFQAPLLRAEFARGAKWQLQSVDTISVSETPASHQEFIIKVATEFLAGRPRRVRRKTPALYDLAILHRPDDPEPPSNARALRLFVRAAEKAGMEADLITKDDFGRLPQYDALFIRETTAVTNHTFRFARRAEAEGLVVIDDPESILKCTNKVYLAELLTRQRIGVPRTVIVHRDNRDIVPLQLGFPCILKQPDSSFSLGVIKVDNPEAFDEASARMLERSELIIAQEFLPTPYDWRIGVLDGEPLYACKYFMAGRHWQIIHRDRNGKAREGKVECFDLQQTPPEVLKTAVRAARLIGRGLYGVDLKHIGRRCFVVEINDNPSIDAGFEDAVLKGALYDRVIQYFLRRLEERKAAPPPRP